MPATSEAPKLERPQGVMHRSLSGKINRLRAEGEGEDKVYRYEFRASSDAAVEMWSGLFEVLDHSDGAIRLDWLNSGNAPLLKMHNRHEQVGVVESARVEGNSIIVTVRVASSETKLISDLEDDIVRNVSIGYRVHAEKLTERITDENGNTVRVTWTVSDWEPTEVSFVSIPADRTVGLGRGENAEVESRVKYLKSRLRAEPNTTMPNEAPTTTEPARTPTATGITTTERDDAVKAERLRIAGITAAANRAAEHNLGDHQAAAQKFIEEGRSVADFNAHVLDNVPKAGAVTQRDLGITEKEAKRFDLRKLIDGLTRGDMKGCEYELEVSDAVKERGGKSNDRVALPLDVVMRGYRPHDERLRDLFSVGLSGAGQNDTGQYAVETALLADMFIESLRADSVVLGLGVTMLPGLTGDVTIPKELVNPSFFWVGEDTEPTEGDYELGQIALSFKTVAGRVPFTRQSLKQTTPNIESLLTNSLRRGIAIAAGSALINGTGLSGQPLGVLGTSGIGAVTTSGTVTHDHLLELEEDLGLANADTANAVTVTNSRGKRRLFAAKKDAGSGIFLAERTQDGGFVTDIGRGVVDNNVPSNLGVGTDKTAIIHGNWRSLLVAMWGGLELTRDTATKAATGGVVLRVFQDMDCVVSRAAEFAAIQDLT